MAEKIKRGYFEILEELFLGPKSALEKYAKVRFVLYEMNLWRNYGLPLKEVDSKAKRYFNVRFLGEGLRIDKADKDRLDKAFESLQFAVGRIYGEPTGCHKRCLKLVNELNEALVADGLEPVKDAEKFLDFFTFDYENVIGWDDRPVLEKPYGFEIRNFHDAENRKEFRMMLKLLREEQREMSMEDIWRVIRFLQRKSKTLKRGS